MGLAPEVYDGPPSFIGYLKRQNIIANKMVSIYIGNNASESKLQIGGYDSFNIKKNEDDDGYGIHWFTLEEDDEWEIPLHELRMGDDQINNGREVEAFFDTGSQLIYIHSDDFDNLMGEWSEHVSGIQCSSQLCYV